MKVVKMSVPPSRWVRSPLEVSGMLASSGYPRLYYVFAIYNIVATTYCFGGSLAYFIIMEGSTKEKLQCIQITLNILSAVMKLCNAGLQQKKLRTLLLDYDGLWNQLYEELLNREIMDISAKSCMLLYTVFKYFMTLTISMNIILALVIHMVMGVDQLSYQIYMPFDHKKYYIPLQTTQFMLSASPFLINATSFFLYIIISEQLATCMRVIRRKLREEKLSKQTIREHQEIIRLVNNTNDLFSWLLYFETSATSVECSCSAYTFYKVHIKGGKRGNILANLINFGFCYFIPYVICYCGNKVTTESELLFRDAYNSMWYEHDLKAKKELRMVMLAASKTLNLQYKNIAVFGRELFRSIINVTFNVFNAIIWLDHADQHN
nr:odorant receptor 70 [Graphosoma rubrolineatum]